MNKLINRFDWNKKPLAFTLGALCSLSAALPVSADDTEVFYAGSTVKPNVLLVLDTSGSMGWPLRGYGTTKTTDNPIRMTTMKAALNIILNDAVDMNIGIAGFTSNASEILVPVIPLDEIAPGQSTKTGRTLLKEKLNGMSTGGGTPAVGAIYEALRYLKGSTVDYTTGNDATIAKTIGGAETYISPINVTCENDNNIILLTDGEAGTTITSSKVTGLTSKIAACTGSGAQKCGVDLAKYMAHNDQLASLEGDQRIKLHTIGFTHKDTWLEALASKKNGRGTYKTAATGASLVSEFKAIFGDILEANSTYTSAGISINSSNRLNHNNEVYFSLFKPSSTLQWDGNLKKYKIDKNGNIIDKRDVNAIDPATGYFSSTSQGLWSASPDGEEVSAGGAANLLTGNERTVYSNLNDASKTLYKLTPATLTDSETKNFLSLASFGTTSTGTTSANQALLKNLVLFTRGQQETGTHPSLLRIQDPLHSRPQIVDYETIESTDDETTESTDDETTESTDSEATEPAEDNTDIVVKSSVVFFGDNQGLLHAIDSESGEEHWSFIPKKLLKNQNSLRNNSHHQNNHVYGLDGTASTWITETSKSLYIGNRRGGSNYYALNIKEKLAPTLKWVISKSASTSNKWHELGQTWSRPVKTKVNISDGTSVKTRDVLVFGGGYDTNQDSAVTRSADSQGRAIYIVDADTGNILWMAGHSSQADADLKPSEMQYSIPSDVKVIDTNNNGIADQMFVGDMGGQIWRFSMDELTGKPSGGVVAQFGDNSASGNQRFYHPPDVSLTSDGELAVAIGSGYHASPLSQAIHDRFYLLKLPLVPPALAPTKLTLSDLYNVTGVDNSSVNVVKADLTAKEGWYIDLETNGEKVLAPSITSEGAIWFTTFQPTQQKIACNVTPGTSYLYRVNVTDGSPVYKNTIQSDTETDEENCNTANCLKEDRRFKLKTGSLPPSPVMLKLGGSKIVGAGTELKKYGESKAKTMYWSQQ